MCAVNQLVNNFFTFFVINEIKGDSVKQNVIGNFVDASDVGCIVVCVCLVQMYTL